MTRKLGHSLDAGGLNWASLPHEAVRRRQREVLESRRHRLLARPRGLGVALRTRTRLGRTAVRAIHRRRGSRHPGHPAVHGGDAGRGAPRRRDVSDAVRVRRGQAHAGVPALARRRRADRRPAPLPRRPACLPPDVLRGAAQFARGAVDRCLAGRAGARFGDVQPRHRRHDGTDGILCVAPDLP